MRKIILLFLLFLSGAVLAAKEPTIYSEDKLAVMLTPDQTQFTIKLKSNPTTGYSWFLRAYDDKLLKPIKHSYVANSNRKLVGAPGFEVWVFAAKPNAFAVPQQTLVRFVYARPWDVNEQSTQLVFRVSTIARDCTE